MFLNSNRSLNFPIILYFFLKPNIITPIIPHFTEMERYNFKKTEKKWQKYWEDNNSFKFDKNDNRQKYYVLSMFPYPSGELHVGHLRNFTIGDIIARFKRMQGYNVLHPMGADAFGLPAENAAIKKNINPEEWTINNIEKFKTSMKLLGLSFDYSRFFATCLPDYYGKQQEIFIKLFKKGLAYQKESFVNWDPVDQTVLANEQIVNGRGWRSGAVVEKKKLKQWFFKTTNYAEELLNDLEKLDGWPKKVKLMQKNWIGRSEGALVDFNIADNEVKNKKVIELDCLEPWFSCLKDGTKTIEGRKNSTKYQNIKGGTIIKFKNNSDSFLVEVLKVEKYKNVREYLESNDLSRIAPFASGIDEVEKIYRDMVTDIDNYEFLAFHVRRIYDKITVYTTRPDTLFGASFVAISANHPLAEQLAKNNKNIADFIEDCGKTSIDEETIETTEKKGMDTGLKVIHPFNSNIKLPVYIANFVLMDYGTGAIFACPAHDKRDYDFAKKYGLPITKVIECEALPFEEDGIAINSDFLNGLTTKEAKVKAIEKIEELGIGKKKINYRLRDWGFSRQRYWGCPIPVVYCEKCGTVHLENKDLPLKLPKDVEFTGKGNPLENHPTWKYTKCPKCGSPAIRETDTMDTFVDSSWYFFRYPELTEDRPFNSELCEKLLPIDQYVGGVEHAILHLIYCRFFTKALRDCGYFKMDEPVKNLFNLGMVCHKAYRGVKSKDWCYPWNVEEKNGKYYNIETKEELSCEGIIKVSKSKLNVIDMTKVTEDYGADAARVFIMSDNPADEDFEWTEDGIDSCWKYINRFYRLAMNFKDRFDLSEFNCVNEIVKNTHKTIKAVTNNLNKLEFNKAIAKIRELTNFLEKVQINSDEEKKSYSFALVSVIKLFMPFAPHLCCELLETFGIGNQDWPSFNEEYTIDNNVTIALQVNGKLRGTINVPLDFDKNELEKLAKEETNVAKYIGDKAIKKTIVVPNKLVNFVV